MYRGIKLTFQKERKTKIFNLYQLIKYKTSHISKYILLTCLSVKYLLSFWLLKVKFLYCMSLFCISYFVNYIFNVFTVFLFIFSFWVFFFFDCVAWHEGILIPQPGIKPAQSGDSFRKHCFFNFCYIICFFFFLKSIFAFWL